jgi:hypothetical protein
MHGAATAQDVGLRERDARMERAPGRTKSRSEAEGKIKADAKFG